MVNTDPHGTSTERGGSPRARVRRRSTASAPVARIATGRVAEPTHRNPVWALGGVLLVFVSAIGGVLVVRAGDERTDSLIAARAIAAGDVVARDDFRIRRIAADGLDIVEPGEVDSVVGRRAVGPVPAGALVDPAMFSDVVPIGPDEMEIGAALEPGAFPRTDLGLGAAVELLVVGEPAAASSPTTAPGETGGPVLSTVTSIGRGSIVAVEARANGQLLVTVRVGRTIGLTASHAAADGRLRLALVGDG